MFIVRKILHVRFGAPFVGVSSLRVVSGSWCTGFYVPPAPANATLTSLEGFVNGSQFETPSFTIVATLAGPSVSFGQPNFTVVTDPAVPVGQVLSGAGNRVRRT